MVRRGGVLAVVHEEVGGVRWGVQDAVRSAGEGLEANDMAVEHNGVAVVHGCVQRKVDGHGPARGAHGGREYERGQSPPGRELREIAKDGDKLTIAEIGCLDSEMNGAGKHSGRDEG